MKPWSAATVLVGLLLVSPLLARAADTEIPLGANVSLGGRRLLPDDSPWYRDVSQDPVDPRSAEILARIGLDTPLHPDFGTQWEGNPIGVPYVVVSKDQPKVPVTFTYADESDPGPYPVPPDPPVEVVAGAHVQDRPQIAYPVPPDAPVEGGPKAEGDRHILVLDRDGWVLWEMFNASSDGKGGWTADSGAVWNLKENQVRKAGWTSADAAGLPILPGLVRFDEVVEKKSLDHAMRFTLSKTRRAYLPPASHWASELDDETLPPMGMRVRLKAAYDLSGFAPEAQVILQAMKTYGMILADNGSDNFISGAPHPGWNDDALHQLSRVKTEDLEVVEMKDVVTDR